MDEFDVTLIETMTMDEVAVMESLLNIDLDKFDEADKKDQLAAFSVICAQRLGVKITLADARHLATGEIQKLMQKGLGVQPTRPKAVQKLLTVLAQND